MASELKLFKAGELRELHERAERVRLAAAEGVRAALRRHMLLGESVVVADDNGGARWIGPDEIRRALDEGFVENANNPPAT